MYVPGAVEDVATQVELEAVSRETREPRPEFGVVLPQLNAAPSRVEDGLVVYADGTNWDPGSGEGVYAYYNSTWNKL